MRTLTCLALLVALLCGSGGASAADRAERPQPPTPNPQPPTSNSQLPAPAQATPGACVDGVLPSAALSRICVPSSGWNGALLVYAHGYVAPTLPVAIDDPAFSGTPLSSTIQSLGYAFATTSYRRNGLAILEGVDDIRELVAAFPEVAGQAPSRSYLIGFSEGGLISALLAERSPTLFSGVVAACGPIGDFRQQINYFGDFRVLFDYFYPGQIPASPVNIPPSLLASWTNPNPAISSALASSPISATQLISVALDSSLIPIVRAAASRTISTTQNLLWYNILATNDARAQLGGNPYSNIGRVYTGSSDDAALNAGVQRFDADQAALAALARYQTTGRVINPLIVLHTTGDDVIPFSQATLYMQKVGRARNVTLIRVNTYGHCAFGSFDLLSAFSMLVQQATSVRPQVFLSLVRRG
jgi:pimeloyl-ACP methyl ester carboxylesterase